MTNCPYCSEVLSKEIKRKAVCPFCGKTIYVRNGEMVTEFKANKIDWIKRVDWLGITESQIDSTQKELSERFKQEPIFNDICWNILNKSLAKSINKPENQKNIYFEMAHILLLEGKENKELIAKASRIELLKLKKEGEKFVSVMTCNDDHVCDNCKKMANGKISIDLAIETNPIPNYCSNKYCRCWYG